MRRSLIASIAVIFSLPAFSWQGHTQFEHLTADNGLSGNWVRCITQDRDGFLWVGTQDGLNRYDGYEFAVFKPDPADPTTLSNNMVLCLFVDSLSRLWVGTNGGLNRFHAETQNFTRYLHRSDDPDSLSGNVVHDIVEDKTGKLWVATDRGLNYFDPETGRASSFRHRPDRPDSLSDDVVRALAVESDGTLWVGTNNGLNRTRDGRSFERYHHDPNKPGSLGDDEITSLLVDSRGLLWAGTFGGGMSLYRPETNDFKVYKLDKDNSNNFHDNVSDICEGFDGSLWITTLVGIPTSGLHRFDFHDETFIRYRHNPSNAKSLTWNYATAVFMDRSGILWAGTSRGLNKMDDTTRKFNVIRQYPRDLYSIYDNYYAVYQSRDGILWLGLDLGMFLIIDRKTGSLKPVVTSDKDTTRGGTYAILEDRKGRIWIGSVADGLIRYDRASGKMTYRRHDPRTANSISGDYVSSIYEDANGALWLATLNGLNRFDPELEVFKVYRHDPGNPRSLSNDKVSIIYGDSAGVMWVGTGPNFKNSFVDGSSGLNRYHPQTDDFTIYAHDPDDPESISDNEINCIQEDSRGYLWVGTNNGLNRLNRETGRFIYYLQKDGLPSPVIRGVLEADNGELWISTVNGLSRFNPVSHRFRNYGLNDGLQHVRFNKNSYFKNSSGEMFFGGVRGLNAFYPDKVKDNQYTPGVVFTGLQLFNRDIRVGEDSVMQTHISRTQKLRLAYNQNDIAVTFAALHFSRPEQNLYRFYLEHYDENWRRPGHERTASYTNLDPGRYRLHVQATNSDGVWNREGISLDIVIDPPWWSTWWAYTLYASMALALLVLAFHIQIARTQRNMERRAEKEREAARLREAQLAKKAAEAQAQAIEADNRRKTEELEKARSLQLSMLPRSLPELSNLRIAAVSQTATEVGGDYYDFRLGSDGSVIVAVGDATGHGLHAGTMVAATKSLFNALAADMPPADFLNLASNALKDMGYHNMYMGMIVGIIQGHNLCIASAGMPFPLLYRAAERRVEELAFRTLPLGALTNYHYVEQRLDLAPGDTLLLMSDGLPEMFNEASQILGASTIKERFAEVGDGTAREVLHALSHTGRDWAGARAQEDDVTLLVIKSL
ncbi:MAG: two-component regulator propeller domain-containing protein [Acidobacteriota bacterium]|nr:two-component regulator propeller domain-containing protein [Acidobacteriota bacterium]